MTSEGLEIGSAIFNADHGRLAEAVLALDQCGIDFIHWDVFDGHFIPDLGFPPATIAAVRDLTARPFEVHLGAEDPIRFLRPLAEAGVDLVFLPVEATPLLFEAIMTGRDLGLRMGASLALATPIGAIQEILSDLDRVLILARVYGETVAHPSFDPRTVAKVRELKRRLAEAEASAVIEVTGGLRAESASEVAQVGASALGFGSGLHRHGSVAENLRALRQAVMEASQT